MKAKLALVSLIVIGLNIASCGKKSETINAANDTVNSPSGYWVTQDSKAGSVGWKIDNNEFKKCYIALNLKVTERTGRVNIEGSTVKYYFGDSQSEYTAQYNSDDNTLTEKNELRLKFVRANDDKIKELNDKGCHL